MCFSFFLLQQSRPCVQCWVPSAWSTARTCLCTRNALPNQCSILGQFDFDAVSTVTLSCCSTGIIVKSLRIWCDASHESLQQLLRCCNSKMHTCVFKMHRCSDSVSKSLTFNLASPKCHWNWNKPIRFSFSLSVSDPTGSLRPLRLESTVIWMVTSMFLAPWVWLAARSHCSPRTSR